MAGPLMSKLKVNREDGRKGSTVSLKWTEEEIECFQALKRALAEELELFQVKPDQPFQLKTDANHSAIGAVLEEEKEGKWVPVGFYSRKLTSSQLNWTPREKKEAYAIVASLRKWASWIGFSPVHVNTDHRSLGGRTCGDSVWINRNESQVA